ncbi:MAG: hypothetical protein DHS20C21_20040 [Gemmatimonadota bacterium]|nr:MAG: hypothetical protein DHS20C21_20040 [Gemmatimonadota bacterium]
MPPILFAGRGWIGLALAALTGLTACGQQDGPRADAETIAASRAIDEKAGSDFLGYYEDVILLAQRYSAHPDSFRVALEALPGSRLTDEEWEAWVAPYAEDPRPVAAHLEEVIASLSVRR